ncbi:MAG: hypothetical protein IKJ01_05025 [Lachnospiraceae bacterium]|nr:hypothetical protein [Lachnospiraceae bacterium]
MLEMSSFYVVETETVYKLHGISSINVKTKEPDNIYIVSNTESFQMYYIKVLYPTLLLTENQLNNYIDNEDIIILVEFINLNIFFKPIDSINTELWGIADDIRIIEFLEN